MFAIISPDDGLSKTKISLFVPIDLSGHTNSMQYLCFTLKQSMQHAGSCCVSILLSIFQINTEGMRRGKTHTHWEEIYDYFLFLLLIIAAQPRLEKII